MPNYSIARWDAVISGDNDYPLPMIYIKPEKSFYEYAKENNYTVTVKIENSDSVYDSRPILGYIKDSATFPNYRPNFHNETQLVIIVLFTNWAGYPKNNGKVFIQGMKGEDSLKHVNTDIPVSVQIPQAIEFYNESRVEFPTLKVTIFAVLLIISVFLILN